MAVTLRSTTGGSDTLTSGRWLMQVLLLACLVKPAAAGPLPPNIVVILIDDLGYADVGPFGGDAFEIETPNLDRLASEGRRFTDFVVSTAVCSASRASLLTGCYHRRIGITGALGPNARHGLNADEMTIAELCKQRDYATACYGKWHLGHHPKFLPTNHGFDEYYGLPYSNDMWPYHPNFVNLPVDSPLRKDIYPPLPLLERTKVINPAVDPEAQAQLTIQYTERAVSFIETNRHRPFLLYVPHSMVHVPLYVSKRFAGQSKRGLFGDVMLEVDWSVGEIVRTLEKHNLTEKTLVVFTSDNGPWLSYGHHAGSASPLREGKGTMLEGGYRVPTIMKWPDRIAAGSTCDELASTIDLLPTIAKLIDAKLPEHTIDGKDISELMFGRPDARSPHDGFCCYYAGGQLQAVRDRQWKLCFRHAFRTLAGRYGGRDGMPSSYDEGRFDHPALYDLKNDVAESQNVAALYPKIVARLNKVAKRARQDLGDRLRNIPGEGIRPAGQLVAGDEQLKW